MSSDQAPMQPRSREVERTRPPPRVVEPENKMSGPVRTSAYCRLATGIFLAGQLLTLAGCSGSGPLSTPATLSSVSLSALTPATTSLQSGQQVQFAVSVSGTSNTALSWSIVDATGASHASGDTTVGTISDAGLYTAPVVTSTMTLTLLVGATADTSVQRSATVTVMPVPPPVAITISPTAGSAQACAQSPCPSISTVNFAATVANATDPSVTWKVNGIVLGDATVGHISTGGTYTAPTTVPNPATVTVTAVSNQDPTKSAGATVTITAIPPPIVVTLNQTSVTLLTGQSFAFTATDSQGNPLPVTFTLTCSASDCGSLPNPGTATATYIAPSNLPGNATLNVSVVVTSVADPTKSATAAVTINPHCTQSDDLVQ